MKRRGRVLCVSSNFPRFAGDSTTPFVLHLCQDLLSLGWEVDVVAPHAPGILQEEQLAGVKVRRFRYAWPESAQTVCYQGGALVNLRKRPLEKIKLPALVLSEWLEVQPGLLAGDYDLVHSHWILPQGFVGSVAARLAKVPHVITVHGGDLFSLRGRLMTALKRLALSGADAVTVNSSFTEAAVRELSPSHERIERIPMGVDARPLTFGEQAESLSLRAKYASGVPLIGFVGRMVEEKGVSDLLHALHEMKRAGVEFQAVFAGEGQDRANFEKLAFDLELADRVKFLGWVDPEQVRPLLVACDVLVAPSKKAPDGWVEAQGLSILEAMALGVVVIASRLGGIVDSVVDGETGFLVPPGDPRALADRLLRGLRLGEDRRIMARRAVEHVEGGFTRSQSAERFDRLFRSLLP